MRTESAVLFPRIERRLGWSLRLQVRGVVIREADLSVGSWQSTVDSSFIVDGGCDASESPVPLSNR